MTDPSRPVTGYPAQPQNSYPPQQNPNYYYQNHNPNYYAPQQQYPPQRATFLRRFFAALIAVFIIFGTVLFIVWLILRPRVPVFTVESFSVSSLNTTDSSISGIFSANFSVGNPNHKLHVYYDEVESRLYYRSSQFAQNTLRPFDQSVKTESTLLAKMTADSAYIGKELVGEIGKDRSKGSVNFKVQVLTIVRFKAGGWRARRRFLRVFCDDLLVGITANGTGVLSGGRRRCAVGI